MVTLTYLGTDKMRMQIKGTQTFGIIEPYENKHRPYAIKIFHNGVYQTTKYGDDMAKSKRKLKAILDNIEKEEYSMITTFESFCNHFKVITAK